MGRTLGRLVLGFIAAAISVIVVHEGIVGGFGLALGAIYGRLRPKQA